MEVFVRVSRSLGVSGSAEYWGNICPSSFSKTSLIHEASRCGLLRDKVLSFLPSNSLVISLLDDMSTEFRLFLRLSLGFPAPSNFADGVCVLGTTRSVVLVSALDLFDKLSPYENKAEM